MDDINLTISNGQYSISVASSPKCEHRIDKGLIGVWEYEVEETCGRSSFLEVAEINDLSPASKGHVASSVDSCRMHSLKGELHMSLHGRCTAAFLQVTTLGPQQAQRSRFSYWEGSCIVASMVLDVGVGLHG
jgi:hypothetical protein